MHLEAMRGPQGSEMAKACRKYTCRSCGFKTKILMFGILIRGFLAKSFSVILCVITKARFNSALLVGSK